jgi:hypothetical protein
VQLNGEHLIRLPCEDSKTNYLDGFWRWVAILAGEDYQRALEALFWPTGTTWTPSALKESVTKFFGGNDPWSVVIPNDRLVNVINEASEHEAGRQGGGGWFMAQIPLTTEPGDPKNDQIPLMGLATSFFVREHQGSYVLEFEIFHL